MSKYFKKVEDYYNNGLWSITRVRNAVEKNWITEEEFKIITGEAYSSPEAVSEAENE